MTQTFLYALWSKWNRGSRATKKRPRCWRGLRREWMGVEPTGAHCSWPPTDFEDRGTHRGTSTPTYQKNTSIAVRGQVLTFI